MTMLQEKQLPGGVMFQEQSMMINHAIHGFRYPGNTITT